MKIEIVENRKQSLFAYKNDELLFYSTIKFNWLKKNLVKIFDSNDDLILELQSYEPPFSSPKYKILFQDIEKTKDISEITEIDMFFNLNKSLRKTKGNYFSFNTNFSYFSETIKIADIKQKFWSSTQKMYLEINDENIDFLNYIMIHILSTRTGYNSNVD
ncbi:hypothetical protein [Flavobacterium sp. Root420]|uniref:hypothetical protein n=1 Tax=Flavobacterium sp. Root420 TaxID=1736533 RepID=UPI0006F54479|nr:hypothetical protein [Flavobacterium sp. Root420]KQX00624.1 hypothetical protein ASC72_07060 [Flavobacterium sp. Root420]